MQSVLRVLYPPQCISCGDIVAETGALCGACWQETPFLGGSVCDCCGAPMVGAVAAATGPEADRAKSAVARTGLKEGRRGRSHTRWSSSARS